MIEIEKEHLEKPLRVISDFSFPDRQLFIGNTIFKIVYFEYSKTHKVENRI